VSRASKLPARARVARTVMVLLLVWVLASGILLFLARQRASSGLDALQKAGSQLTADSLLQGKGLHALQEAQRDFSSAHGLASNPALVPWRLVPIAGNNVGSVRGLTGSAKQVARLGATAARDGSAALRQHPSTGDQRLALLNNIAAIADRAHQGLARLDLGPDSQLIGPVANARVQFLDRLNKLRTATADATALAAGAAHLLSGPRRYLVLAANNAEMRAGSGMLLEAGSATFAQGSFTIGPMVSTNDINVPPGAVALSANLAALWGWVTPNQTWTSLATTPRFDETAPLAAQMWQAATGQSVDGVLAVDPVALQALLAAQGPIQVGGQQLSGDTVVSYLLMDQYSSFSGDPTGHEDRRDQLGSVAQASVDALASRPWQAASLVSHLTAVGKGRHVLAWAKDPVEERAWQAAGIDGALKSDSLAVSVMNFGGNKLDPFLTVDATLSIQPRGDGSSDAQVKLQLHNRAPTGLVPYVAGPNSITTLVAGEYQGILAVNVPGAASLPSLRGVAPLIVAGVDGPTKVVAGGYFQIPRGQTLDAEADFRLPAGLRELQVESSARVPPISWHYRHQQFLDTASEHVVW
jgi:hypothetical protein